MTADGKWGVVICHVLPADRAVRIEARGLPDVPDQEFLRFARRGWSTSLLERAAHVFVGMKNQEQAAAANHVERLGAAFAPPLLAAFGGTIQPKVMQRFRRMFEPAFIKALEGSP